MRGGVLTMAGWVLASGCSLDTDALVGRSAGGGCPDCDAGPLPGEPLPEAPGWSVDPPSIDFGRVLVGRTADRDLAITHGGAGPLRVRSIEVAGSADFVVVVHGVDAHRRPDVLLDPDRDGEPGLAPGATFQATVRFRPSEEPFARATVIIRTDAPVAPRLEVPLAGNAGVPCLTATPSPLTFDGTLAGRADTREVRLVNCGDEPVEIRGLRLREDSAGELSLDDPPRVPFVLPAHGAGRSEVSLPVRVVYAPRAAGAHAGTLLIEPAAPKPPPLLVRIAGRAVENECPRAVAWPDAFTVEAGGLVHLDGTRSLDPDGPRRRPVRWSWAVIDAPEDARAEVVERYDATGAVADDPTTPAAQLLAHLPGRYELELRVADELGLDSETCGTSARVVVTASSPIGLRVHLTWQASGETAADLDLDLHLLHPSATDWFQTPFDCYYGDSAPDWGAIGHSESDPWLDQDDDTGRTGEIVRLVDPEDTSSIGGPYRIGAHYFRAGTRPDVVAAQARVQVWFDGELAWTSAERRLDRPDRLWEVAALHWPERRIVEIDRETEVTRP